MAQDMVPATAPISRFDPSMVSWYGHTLSGQGETVWAIEALHLNAGRRLYISDLTGGVQNRWAALHRARTRAKKSPVAGGTANPVKATSPPATGPMRRHGGEWRGLHMIRTCKSLVKKGLAEWPEDANADPSQDGRGTIEAPTAAAAGSAATTTTIKAILPGGKVVRTVRVADSARAMPGRGRIGGRPPTIMLPRLTSAGRIAWMQTRLGLLSRETLVLALLWQRFVNAGYFVKSNDMIRENVWMTDRDIAHAFGSLVRKGYLDQNKKTGQIMHIRRARRIEPYGPMLEVIEDMVYGARAGEYVYGDAYDDEINAAYAKTVAALGEGGAGGREAAAAAGKTARAAAAATGSGRRRRMHK